MVGLGLEGFGGKIWKTEAKRRVTDETEGDRGNGG